MTLWGAFGCIPFQPHEVTVEMQGQEVGSGTVPDAESDCYCANCVTTFIVSKSSAGPDWPSYVHGGINAIQVFEIDGQGMCVSSVDVNVSYSMPYNSGLDMDDVYIFLGGLGVLVLIVVAFIFVLRRTNTKTNGYQLIREGREIKMSEVEIGPRIGKGNFGEVFKGLWRGVPIAVKKIPAHNISEQFWKEFHKELNLMKSLRHPNVLQFLGSCSVPPDVCILVEFMPKGSLYSVLHNPAEKLTWALIRRMMLDAAAGCLYLHTSDPVIVHRDLKSHNLLVDENYKVKVSDFGLSTMVVAASQTMTACGTPCWTAPEILRNQRYTERADVYSFGIVLYECASREDPYAGLPPFQVIFSVATQHSRPNLPLDTPDAYASLARDCWHEDPTVRPNFAVILERLTQFDAEQHEYTAQPNVVYYSSLSPSEPDLSDSRHSIQ